MNDFQRRFLNVGGNSKTIPVPPHYAGFEHHLLDIDPRAKPDVVADARELAAVVPAGSYDAIYCSHNLEHYHRHEVPKVLGGFRHALKPDGFVELRVPDIHGVAKTMLERKLDIDDVLYDSPAGPITVRDVIWGHGGEIERSGKDWFAHKTGFSQRSLCRMLNHCGFPIVFSGTGNYEVLAYAFTTLPADWTRALLKIPAAAVDAAQREAAARA